MFQPGEILDHTYQIVEEIGAGGAGVIYKAYHLRLQKYVVIKKIKENFVGQLNVRGEADILKGLHHTYLPQIYDFRQYGTDVYTIMEYICGYDLEYYRKCGYQFTEGQILYWLHQLAEVLEYLHGRKPAVIHSDIKPANIMITDEGNVCLIDFNIAFNEEDGILTGYSNYFASPEQYKMALYSAAGMRPEGLKLDGRSDIYSLGASFYYLLSGCLPDNNAGIQPLADMPIPYSEGLRCMIDKMMNPDREKRYASAEKLAYAVLHVKEQGRQYRSLVKIRNMAAAGYAVGMIVFLLMIIKGIETDRYEKFSEAYSILYSEYEHGNLEEASVIGVEMINNPAYAGLRKENKQELGSVFYLLGEVYFEKEEYETACVFYEEALKRDSTHADYYRDYAVALACNKEYDKAVSVLKEADAIGLEDEELAYIWAQIYWREGNLEEAYYKMKSAVAFYNIADSSKLLRQYVILCYQYGMTLPQQERSDVLEQAQEICSNLIQNRYAVFADYYNLALLYEVQEKLEESKAILREMSNIYGEDYRIYAHLASVEYGIQMKRTDGSYDFYDIRNYCRKAEELSLSAGIKEDADMEMVRAIWERIQ